MGAVLLYIGYPLRLTEIPYREGDQGERWWEPVGGTATQMTVSHGLMLVGVNSRVEEETVLKAFRLFRLPDLYLQILDTPASAGEEGFTAVVRPACTGCETTITTSLKLTIGGITLPPRKVTFGPGIDPGTFLFESGPMRTGATVEVVATIDPEDLIAESNEANNTLRSTVLIVDTACCAQPGSRWGSKLTD